MLQCAGHLTFVAPPLKHLATKLPPYTSKLRARDVSSWLGTPCGCQKPCGPPASPGGCFSLAHQGLAALAFPVSSLSQSLSSSWAFCALLFIWKTHILFGSLAETSPNPRSNSSCRVFPLDSTSLQQHLRWFGISIYVYILPVSVSLMPFSNTQLPEGGDHPHPI